MSKDTVGGIHYEIMKRCYNTNSVMYKNYGGKGISVCPEWHDKEVFQKWAMENGFKKGLKLKRIDSLLDYSPDNCCFSEKNIVRPRKPRKEKPEYLKIKAQREEENRLRESFGVPKKFSKLRIYRVYRGMITRGSKATGDSKAYQNIKKYYNQKGITVCDEWQGRIGFYHFYAWSMENGYEDSLSIDRIDNSKGYSPDNCRWIQLGLQTRNRDNNVRYNYHGENLLLIEICEKEDISYDALKYRVVKRGQDLEYAIKEIRKHKERMDELNNPERNPMGCAIKNIRKKTGLTQEEFAKKYHIADKTVQAWEEGKENPSDIALYLLRKMIRSSDGVA